MLKLRLPVFTFVIALGALNCSSDDPSTPNASGGTAGSGGSTGGSGGSTGGSGGGTQGDSGACPKFDYTNYNPTMSPTMKKDIQPILTISCALSSSCHQNGSTHHPNLGPSSLQLDGGPPSDAIMQAMIDELKKASAEVVGRNIMVAGKPEDSYVMNKLDGNNNCSGFMCMGPDKCGVSMPDPTPLEKPQLDLVRAWIKKGAPL